MILWILGAVVLLIVAELVAVYWYLESAKRLIGLDRNPMRFFLRHPIATLRWARLTRRAWQYLSRPIPKEPPGWSLLLGWPSEYLQQSLKHHLLGMGRAGKFTLVDKWGSYDLVAYAEEEWERMNWPIFQPLNSHLGGVIVFIDEGKDCFSRRVQMREYKHLLYLKWSGRRGEKSEQVSPLFITATRDGTTDNVAVESE